MLLKKNPSGGAGIGALLSSTSYLMYGVFTATLSSGYIPGMVTSFISMSDVKDEIDWEFVGGDVHSAQTNFFIKGVVKMKKI